jgi:hypothetical protein
VPLTRSYIPKTMAQLLDAECAWPDYAALHLGKTQPAQLRSGTS